VRHTRTYNTPQEKGLRHVDGKHQRGMTRTERLKWVTKKSASHEKESRYVRD
jgi:hypothetical protein